MSWCASLAPAARGSAKCGLLASRRSTGADISLHTLMNNVAWSCPHPRPGSWHRRPGKYQMRCGIFLPDLDDGKPPPDMPPVRLRLVKPDAAE
ncbi:MAG: hypothetical protein K0S56_4462 [Microvirga sp.]|nr:hypothetical protein [Microvirga sp.]